MYNFLFSLTESIPDPTGDSAAVQSAITTVMNASSTVWTWMVGHPFTLIGVGVGIIGAGAAIIRLLTGQRRRRGR